MARIKRFTAAQRVFHLLLMLSFLTQAATGMARLYVETNWGRFLASIFGGYNNTLTVHWWVGIFMLALLGVHIIYIFSGTPAYRLDSGHKGSAAVRSMGILGKI
jgi:cytochrome b subunit of formate dehydrogenase